MKQIVRFKEGDMIPENAKYIDCFQSDVVDGITFLYEIPIKVKKEKETTTSEFDDKMEAIRHVVDHLNAVTGKRFKWQSGETKKLILARMADGFDGEDFIRVIDNMASAWLDDSKMSQYLRPSTLFRASKFENYLNHKSGAQEAADAFADLEEFCS